MPAGRGKLASLTSRLTECKSRAGTSTQVRKRAHFNGRNGGVSTSTWQPRNCGSGKRIWFLSRGAEGAKEYHESSNGTLVRYARYETACKAAARLNSVSA